MLRPSAGSFVLRLAWLVTGLLPFAPKAFAWPPTFGLELNLWSVELAGIFDKRMEDESIPEARRQVPTADGEFRVAKQFSDDLFAYCQPQCRRTEHPGKFSFTEWKFEFEDGFGFNIAVDPSTVEIQVGPWTSEQWKVHEKSLQRFLYDFPARKKLIHKGLDGTESSAHLNIGVRSAFEDDGLSFARYVADYWQYPELAEGLLGNDPDNAPTLERLRPEQREAALAVFEGVNREAGLSPQEVAQRITRQVYTWSPGHEGTALNYHNQAVGMKYVTDPGKLVGDNLGDVPTELRANREPVTAAHATLQVELQQKRLEYLRAKQGEPIFFRPDVVSFSDADKVDAFLMYLGDMGLEAEYKTYAILLPSELRRVKPNPFLMGAKLPAKFEPDERFLRRLHHSSFVRDRFQDFLLSRKALAPEIFEKTLQRMLPYVESEENGPIRALLVSMGAQVPEPIRPPPPSAPVLQAATEAPLPGGRPSLLQRCNAIWSRLLGHATPSP